MPHIHPETRRITRDDLRALAKKVPFSVSNFVRRIDGKLVGMYNRGDWNEGQRRLGCVGGAALITDRKALRAMGADFLDGDDFRVKLPRKNLKDAVDRCSGARPKMAEWDARREAVEELCEEPIGASDPVLEPDMLDGAKFSFAGSAVNVRNGQGACQVFRFFDMETGSPEVLRRIVASRIAFVIDPRRYLTRAVGGTFRHFVVPDGMVRPVRLKDSLVCAIEKILCNGNALPGR